MNCKHCGSKNLTKAGKILQATGIKQQRYQCMDCGRYTLGPLRCKE